MSRLRHNPHKGLKTSNCRQAKFKVSLHFKPRGILCSLHKHNKNGGRGVRGCDYKRCDLKSDKSKVGAHSIFRISSSWSNGECSLMKWWKLVGSLTEHCARSGATHTQSLRHSHLTNSFYLHSYWALRHFLRAASLFQWYFFWAVAGD